MTNKKNIYTNTDLSVGGLRKLYDAHNVTHIYYKKLSPNDNSKNQPYMGPHITELGFLPTDQAITSASTSQKTSSLKRKVKYTFELNFSWLSPIGERFPAPQTKLIYYPQYPEVRLSGFLAGCGFDMDGWMDPYKRGRTKGRVLFIGVTRNKDILAYLAVPDSRLAKEIDEYQSTSITNVFSRLGVRHQTKSVSSREALVAELKRIHMKSWIDSKRLHRGGTVKKYKAQNGGGYTLEAELGIIPNGYAGPDFMGWEIKQFAVSRCDLINSKILTLMTPEPDGGYYVEHGVEAFIRHYGYNNAKIEDRKDFTGRHFFGHPCNKTDLKLEIEGFDHDSGMITDASGKIALIDTKGNQASTWSFAKLMDLWKRKHAKAAYVPSLSRTNPETGKAYLYCNNIRLFEGTSFTRFLSSTVDSGVYYDPGIKLENASTKPTTKRRSQFRIKSKLLGCLYDQESQLDVLE